MVLDLLSHGPDETREIGERIGRLLKPGDVVCLRGDLGAGKTVFIQGVARGLGIPPREIASASFVIVAEHTGSFPLFHMDLYRLDEGGAGGMGLEEYMDGRGIVVVEWPDRAESLWPGDRIEIRIERAGESEEAGKAGDAGEAGEAGEETRRIFFTTAREDFSLERIVSP